MKLPYSSLHQIIASLDLSESLTEEMASESGSVESKEELFQLIQKVGIAGGKVDEAAEIVADMEERINLIQHKLKFINEEQRPSVLVLSGVNPPVFEYNDYLDELLKIVASKVYRAQIADEGEGFNPDIILIISDQMEKIFGDVATLLSLEEWHNTNAVKKNKVFLINGNGRFQGYSSTTADDIETLAEIIYPQYLTFGGNGESWIQFEV